MWEVKEVGGGKKKFGVEGKKINDLDKNPSQRLASARFQNRLALGWIERWPRLVRGPGLM
jgi:hypothetical protein